MKVLILSEDRKIFDPVSARYKELLECSKHIDELHVIVLNTRRDRHLPLKISEKLFLYPTNSVFKINFILDIFKIVRTQIFFKSQAVVNLICSDNSFSTNLGTYLLSRKYRRNYLIDVRDESFIKIDQIKTRIRNHIFTKASGIRVTSQISGEIMALRNPGSEKKIFVLPFLETDRSTNINTNEQLEQIDIHKKFPQFNVIVLSTNAFVSIRDLKRAKSIMSLLALRYRRIGLVVVGEVKGALWHPFFIHSLPDYIVIDRESHPENVLGYKNPNIFIDFRHENEESHQLIYAIKSGYPVVASNTPANSSVVNDGENGFIAEPSEPHVFARKVVDILETPGLREKIHLYSFDMTELYGTDPEDYYKRLISIWKSSETPEEEMLVKPPIVQGPSKIDFYPAFTLDIIKKTFEKFEQNRKEKSTHLPAYKDQDEIFDVDSVKLGIKEALEEIAQDQSFVSEEPMNAPVDITV